MIIGKISSKVLNIVFAPAVALMSKLTYVRKFALATALFALPLSFILVNGYLDRNKDLLSLHEKQFAIERFYEIGRLVQDLSKYRNDSTLISLSRTTIDNQQLEIDKEKILSQLEELNEKPPINRSNLIKLFINKLIAQLSSRSFRNGTEGDSIEVAFNNFNQMVTQLRRISVLLLTESGVFNDHDVISLNIISLLMNDFSKPLENISRAETIGAFFLEKGFINSWGILSLNDISSQLEINYSNLSQQLAFIFQSSGNANQSTFVNVSLLEGIPLTIALVEDTIILDDELNTSQNIFRIAAQKEQTKIFQLKVQLTRFIIQRYSDRIDSLNAEKLNYLLYIGGLFIVSLYLFVGIFFSVENSLLQLIEGARRVESGDLKTTISVETRDELYQLACVFEDMRVKLLNRENELYELTIKDGLTNLFNRKHFNDTLEDQLVSGRRGKTPTSLLLIDIDHFKKLNDEHGHQAGDLCLIEIGKILTKVTERATDMAFRYGGEEFAIILAHTDSNGAEIQAKKVWGAIRSTTITVDNQNLTITASIGIASTDMHLNLSDEQLIHAADQALYKAKAKGRDCYLQSQSYPHPIDSKGH